MAEPWRATVDEREDSRIQRSSASAWPSLKSGHRAPGRTEEVPAARPEKTVLYRVIQQHLESFLEHAHESSGTRLPKYVENEFRRYLECGLHAHGFARAVCETCGDELSSCPSRTSRCDNVLLQMAMLHRCAWWVL
jgi:Transposase zinc-binding domain